MIDLAEEAEERFDEACEHARQRPAFAGMVLGPSLPAPMGRLRAGRLAWSRSVEGPGGRAELYYVLDPVASTSRRGAGELPLVDLARQHVVSDVRLANGSPERLVAVAPAGAPRGFQAFVDAVLAELGSDAE
ncbi:MAG: hypothetical protein L3J91_00895 [Thermoplasmata archaeon]|nr:hypothetical protein [Thermoplasmata archaeon]